VRAVTSVQIARVLTYRSFAARLRQIERIHVGKLRSKPYLARETKRRIAELLLKHATLCGGSFQLCRTRMRRLQELGFTDIETRAFHCLIYAKAARDRGHLLVARKVATNMVDELNRSLRRRKSLLAKANLEPLQALLFELQ
jgi:hypothetical protein